MSSGETSDGILNKNVDGFKKKNPKSKLSTKSTLNDVVPKLSIPPKPVKATIEAPTYESFIKCFQQKGFNSIVTIVGAGISTSAGVPDFRTPDSGLYANLKQYNLPNPQAIFDIDYFMKNPAPFFDLVKQIMPGNFQPTVSHYFIRLLLEKGILLRHYTQNVDGLEHKAGISEEFLIEAHGTFLTSHCVKCHKMYDFDWLIDAIYNHSSVPTCVLCNNIVKPDVIFFGENLPEKFFHSIKKDFEDADLLIIMGSSLLVEPFASLVRRVDKTCPRIIINNQEVGKNVGIRYNSRINKRDVFIKGSCDEGCMKIINSMGWKTDLEELLHKEVTGRRSQ